MKKLICYLFALLALTAISITVFAQPTNAVATAAVSAEAAPQLTVWQIVIVALVPAIIAILKTFLPRLPRWLLPLLAPLIGFALDQIAHRTIGTDSNGWLAMVLGGAGTGLREIGDQLKKVSPTPR